MRFVMLKADQDVSRLAEELYQPRSRAALVRAEEALRTANPHLAEPERLPKGSILVVPEVAGAEPAKTEGQIVVPVLDELRKRLEAIRETTSAQLRRREEQVKEYVEQLKSASIRKLIRDDKESEQQLTEARKHAEEELKRLRTIEKLQREGTDQLEKDLAALLDTFR